MQVNAMVIGAMKCSTTTLADLLKAHPQVSFCAKKEPDHFSKHPDPLQGLDEYHALFPQWEGAVYMEASTSYTFHPNFKRDVWKLLHAYSPELRFIYLVRDPVARIVSHYMHIYQRGYVDLGFEEAMLRMPLLTNVSRYHAQVLPYVEHFGREQILILEFSDLIHKQGETLERVARHIGIDPALFPTAPAKHSHKSVGEGKSHVKFDDPPAWARLLKKATPSRYREKVWRMITQEQKRTFKEKPVMSPFWKEATLRNLEGDILALETLMDRDLTAWWTDNGMQRPGSRQHDTRPE
ncbi:MAG: sulfotransferase [Flavobacteriales bacterium]|nr:sulfotransferase [Flavobacteriales bacterium]